MLAPSPAREGWSGYARTVMPTLLQARHPARWPRRSRMLPAAVALAVAVAACGGTGAPVRSFDPQGPCISDGQQPGAYPELERLLPAEVEGRPPASLDSGRSCTPEALGTLADRGIEQLRFAGATWAGEGSGGMTVAVFEADGLDPDAMIEFYQAGARKARRTEKLQVTSTTVGGGPAGRLDVLQSDGTGQTVVAWPGNAPGRVRVLLAADLGDARVAELLARLAEG